jgi:glycosyltransferase involved in cell wall biosynthesis
MAAASRKEALPPVVLNGKFYASPSSAVNRVAGEIIAALDRLVAQGAAGPAMEVLHPAADPPPPLVAIPSRGVGRLRKQPWEQVDLPAAAGGRLTVNLCNLGPAACGRAVTLIHDAQVFITPQSYSWAFVHWYRTIYRLTGLRHAIVTVSEYSRAELARARIARAERIHIIPNGADHILHAASETGILGRLGLAPGGYALGLASGLPHKNIALLLKAFSRPELADMKLVLFGAASRETFRAQGVEAPANAVFAGVVTDGEVRALMEGALATVTPSRTEGFGLPPLEGMLLGTPAVIAPCGALPEVCGEAALTASPDDPAEWAARLTQLAANPGERAGRAEAGRRRAGEFTWDRSARLLMGVIAAELRRTAGSAPAASSAAELSA